jgi:hypothetical protein
LTPHSDSAGGIAPSSSTCGTARSEYARVRAGPWAPCDRERAHRSLRRLARSADRGALPDLTFDEALDLYCEPAPWPDNAPSAVDPSHASELRAASRHPCEVWSGPLSDWGQPVWRTTRKAERYVARRLWTEHHGQIPRGWCVVAVCGRQACVAAAHLSAAPRGAVLRRSSRTTTGRNVRKDRCLRGHASWGVKPDGARYCIPCHRDRVRVWRERASSG